MYKTIEFRGTENCISVLYYSTVHVSIGTYVVRESVASKPFLFVHLQKNQTATDENGCHKISDYNSKYSSNLYNATQSRNFKKGKA